MRSRWNLPIYGVYIVVCLLVIGFIISGIGVVVPWNHPYQVSAQFRSGDGILASNEVYMNGVKVGRVESVDAAQGKALVHMRIDDTRALPLNGDAGALVRKKNLLGETYVELVKGTDSSHTLATSATIPSSRTMSPVDIDEVLAILDPNTRDRLKLLINGAGDALANNGDNMNVEATSTKTLFEQLHGPATLLSVRKQQLNGVILELERLYSVLARQRDQIRDEFGTWTAVMGQLADQEQAIGGTLQQADRLLQSTDQLVSGEVPALRSILAQLPSALTSTGNFLNQSDTILASISVNRKSIHDVFPDLQTAFSDVDPNSPLDPITGQHQHFWSVYSVNCHETCSGNGTSTASSPAPTAPNALWAAAMGSGR